MICELTKPEAVIVAVCKLLALSAGEVIGPTRTRSRRAVIARTIFVGVMRDVSELSYPELSCEINGRFKAHGTTIGLHRRWQRLSDDTELVGGITKASARAYVLEQLGMHKRFRVGGGA